MSDSPEITSSLSEAEVNLTTSNYPTLETLIPTFHTPYIRLNLGHTNLVLGNNELCPIFEPYKLPDQSQKQYFFIQISNNDLTERIKEMQSEDKAAFHKILLQEIYKEKMDLLIKAYRSSIDHWGQPDITKTDIDINEIRRLVLEALRQQHAVSSLPKDVLPAGYEPFTLDKLEKAAQAIDRADQSARAKGIVFAST